MLGLLLSSATWAHCYVAPSRIPAFLILGAVSFCGIAPATGCATWRHPVSSPALRTISSLSPAGVATTCPLPVCPHYLTPGRIEIAGLRPPSIFGYVAASPPLTCPSIPPRNGHGTHYDMCHFSAIPHYLSHGHLHLAGIPPP